MTRAEKLPDILVRADASTQMGTGHLMRCLALAQSWKAQGGQVVFVSACQHDNLRRRLSVEGFRVIQIKRPYPDPADLETTSKVSAAHSVAWVVIDGYHFDPIYHRNIKEAGYSLLVIDDTAHLDCYRADVLLNQNIDAEKLDYSHEPYTRLLLGTSYVLLRPEFFARQRRNREIQKVSRKILVTLGGGDPYKQTLKVISALQLLKVDGLEAIVLVGATNPHFNELNFATSGSAFPIRIFKNVTNMPEFMAWADVAISGGGSTCWEMAFMGLPNIILVLAENQRGIGEGLSETGAALNLGWFEQVTDVSIAEALSSLIEDRELRRQMSVSGQRLVDGEGGKRVVSALQEQRQLQVTSE